MFDCDFCQALSQVPCFKKYMSKCICDFITNNLDYRVSLLATSQLARYLNRLLKTPGSEQ